MWPAGGLQTTNSIYNSHEGFGDPEQNMGGGGGGSQVASRKALLSMLSMNQAKVRASGWCALSGPMRGRSDAGHGLGHEPGPDA